MILVYTNLLLFVSVLYFCLHSDKNNMECILALFLISVIITSQIFWRKPIKGSFIHSIDG